MKNKINYKLNDKNNNIETNMQSININSTNNKNSNSSDLNMSSNQEPIMQEISSQNSKSICFVKKGLVVGIILTIIFVGLIIIGKYFYFMDKPTNSEISVNMVEIGNEMIALKKGDELTVNGWGEQIEITQNEEELKVKNIPKLYNGVTLGTNVKDVIKKFNIKSGYAILNMEISTKVNDGTTDIIEKSFVDYNSIPNNFLDCAIIFGYNKVYGGWKMVKEKDIEDADIIYYIDINGFNDEKYDLNEVIMFNITYNK